MLQEFKLSISIEFMRNECALVHLKVGCRNFAPSDQFLDGSILHHLNTRKYIYVPNIPYSFGVVNWTQEQLQQLDKQTSEMKYMNGTFHPISFGNKEPVDF